MAHTSLYISPEIKLSVYADSFSAENVVFDDHILVWFMEGETRFITPTVTHTFAPGDIFLFPRNSVAAIFNMPKNDKPNRAAVMHLTVKRLAAYYKDREVKGQACHTGKIFRFSNHPLLTSCMASLIPYFEIGEQLPPEIADIKIHEAITILRTIDPDIDSVLANFEEPGKIPLADFMERNYMFNMPIDKFSYLTGRSLTTFRRDFKKSFQTTPQKWLTQKRLELAHYHIKDKKRRPVEVYIEAGFENLSHFSYAFKKQFGYTPTEV